MHIGIEKLLIQIPLNLFHMEEVMTWIILKVKFKDEANFWLILALHIAPTHEPKCVCHSGSPSQWQNFN